ncbi:MAG: glycosyltransferase [Alphaproteobacteria bacterium]|nr:glycosyltransferase [Alphaproteobacteria bacterium]MBV9694760.1 glycosyltransferase [Alphaproteobacteria bacterium]
MSAQGTRRLGAWPGARVAVLSPTPTHPQDFGNRKRISRICQRYVDEGARLTFIHYPAEMEWREQLPYRAEKAMDAAWTHHFTVAPSRYLHVDPVGDYHAIDEWWDDAIGNFLSWLFSVETFDLFIVNYSWLSKALEYAPPNTFKILDTQDKFSGRRELLESLGLKPEFFYTTEAQESIGLNRADLVWAIKQEEAEQLSRLCEVPVLAMPHLDEFRQMQRPPPDPHGYLRVGIIGARNNINRMNIGEFLAVADPIFRNAFAPVKLMIAGSVCDLLQEIESPFVEMVGVVDRVEEFYRRVDCVAVPMQRSTGLKIKTGEALSLGLPVVSLAHAFEGYEAAHALHRLSDFGEMARALVDLAFEPRPRIDLLATASAQAHRRTNAVINRAFRRSDALALERRRLVVVAVGTRAFEPGTIEQLALKSVYDALRDQAVVAVLAVAGEAAGILAQAGTADRYRRVYASDDLCDLAERGEELAALGVQVSNVSALLAQLKPMVVIADAAHAALWTANLPEASLLLRWEMLAQQERDVVLSRTYRQAVVSAPTMTPEISAVMDGSDASFEAAPILWRVPAIPRRSTGRHASGPRSLAVLGADAGPVTAMAADMARIRGLQCHAVAAQEIAAMPCHEPRSYIENILGGRRPAPDFALDLGGCRAGYALCREMLERLHVPIVSVEGAGCHHSLREGSPLKAASEAELWNAIRFLALAPVKQQQWAARDDWQYLESDRGWTEVWLRCTDFLGQRDVELI